MKLPENVLSDRASTREELFEVLELLGGFEELHGAEPTGDPLAFAEAEQAIAPADILDQVTTKEDRVLLEIEPFTLLERRAERIN